MGRDVVGVFAHGDPESEFFGGGGVGLGVGTDQDSGRRAILSKGARLLSMRIFS